MKKFTVLFFAAFFFQLFQLSAQCNELFFSEYIEGSSLNKAVEIYNPTNNDIDLGAEGYVVKIYSSGGQGGTTTIGLIGTVAAGDVFVLADDGFDDAYIHEIDQMNTANFYNGNDAVELSKNGVTVDIIGSTSGDPGSQWGTDYTSTKDNTIRRKASISGGDTNGADAFNPANEWDGFANNSFDDLGSYTSNCTNGGGSGGGTPTGGCEEIFIAEYIEGSSHNKGIELYNPTANAIDLDGYGLELYVDGNSNAGTTFSFSAGTMIPAGGTYTIVNSQAALISGDETAGVINFNGNDRITLVKDGNIIDAVGEATNGANHIKDRTLVRNANINAGTSSFEADEWTVHPKDYTDNWGIHTSDCIETVCMINSATITDATGCDDNGTFDSADDYYLVDIEVTFSDAPAAGMLELSGAITATVPVTALSGNSYTFSTVEIAANGASLNVVASFTDEPSCFLSTNLGNAVMPCSYIPACTYPYISEYIEGSGNNKCIEIYNPSAEAIDLTADGYAVDMYFNGNTNAGNTIPLEGVVESGASYVLCHSSSSAYFTSKADQTVSGSWFNGDDAVVLSNDLGVLDVIGQIGVDPGSSWSNGGVSTRDMTIRRNFDVEAGDNNGTDAFDPSAEWTAYAQNTGWGLGYQGSNCLPSLPEGWSPMNVGCNEDNNVQVDNGTWTLNTGCYPTNPTTTADHGVFASTSVCGNVEVVAEIESVTNGWGGIAIRESDAPGAKMVRVVRASNPNSYRMEIRMFDNAPMMVRYSLGINVKYIKLTRTGSIFRVYRSSNGTTWFPMMFPLSVVSMNNCVFAGVTVSAGAPSTIGTGVFSGVSINGTSFGLFADESAVATTADVAFDAIETTEVAAFDTNDNVALTYTLTPNPASLFTTLNFNKVMETEATITVANVNGQVVATQNVNLAGSNYDVDLTHMSLTEGIYYLTLTTQEGTITKRFVKVN